MSSVSEVKKKEFTLDEVSKHASAEDCWLIIGNESNGASTIITIR
jgi:cytochrome b involved in lipid metabolism